MNKKMKRYEEGGEVEFESKMGPNENIGDDVRARAMAAMAARDAGETEKPAPKAKPKAKVEAPKREKANPTYTAPPKMAAADRVKKEREKSAKKPSSRSESYGISDMIGAKKGGLMSSASKRADGCAVKGKTRGKMV
jgi:hypothetical protein